MRHYLAGEVFRSQLAKTGLERSVPGDVCRLADGRELGWYFQQMHVNLGGIFFNLLDSMTGEIIEQVEDWDVLVRAITEVVVKKLEGQVVVPPRRHVSVNLNSVLVLDRRDFFPHVDTKSVSLCCVVLVSHLDH